MKPDDALKIKEKVIREVSKYYINGEEALEVLFANLISEGHVILEGSQGLGKTTLAKLFSQAIGVEFKRIQMTSDLLPSDILGTLVWDLEKKEFKIRKGPIFSNIVLIDEINRAPPRTQSALLEAMQEKQVTIDVNTLELPDPFFVIATEVPNDTGGIFPLTITELDRFSSKIVIKLPDKENELKILKNIDDISKPVINSIVSKNELKDMINYVKNVKVDDKVSEYIIDIINELRKNDVNDAFSVRSSIWLYKLSRAMAYLNGRDFVIPDDVKKVVFPALRHRVFNQEINADSLIDMVLKRVKVPKI
ncbi:MAG: AAA family ATPase [Caldisphaera sp.]|jgi:MoxR-like ATPase|uniref:AAA family ATPase n=1 Tax=Caldisphaera sp. TaxID=2060322 RepID=UPI003D0EB6BE